MASTNSQIRGRAFTVLLCVFATALLGSAGASVEIAYGRQVVAHADTTASVYDESRVRTADRARTMMLRTNAPDALVFVDSTLVGRAREGTFAIEPHARLVHLTAPTLGAWSIEPISRKLPEYSGSGSPDTVMLELAFPYHYSVSSDPYGAVVRVLADSLRTVGRTPVRFAVRGSPATEVVLSLDGYHDATWKPSRDLWNRHVATLEPDADSPPPVVLSVDDGQRRWIDVLSLAIAGAGAAAAVHYKFKADRRYDVYAQTGDPALRPQIRRLDTRSAVGLGVMQAGLAVFAIRMVLD